MAKAEKCAAGQQKVAVLWSDLRQCWYIAFWSITGTPCLGRLSAKPPSGCSLVSVRSQTRQTDAGFGKFSRSSPVSEGRKCGTFEIQDVCGTTSTR